jgi:transposase-like protein
MPPRLTPRTRTRQRWQRLVELWRRSGLSVPAFCRRHRLAAPSFYAWRRKLRQEQPPANNAAAPPPVTFLPVHVRYETPEPPPPLELILPSGLCLRVPPGFDPAALRHLLAVLEGPPC